MNVQAQQRQYTSQTMFLRSDSTFCILVKLVNAVVNRAQRNLGLRINLKHGEENKKELHSPLGGRTIGLTGLTGLRRPVRQK